MKSSNLRSWHDTGTAWGAVSTSAKRAFFLARLRIRFFVLEQMLNNGIPVFEFHPWLDTDLTPAEYMTSSECDRYFAELARLRDRASSQSLFCVTDYRRAMKGWLSFRS
jgi:hypothetical protein